MSRSYKKTPGAGDSKGKNSKRIANHKVRQAFKNGLDFFSKGNKYKRVYESYDICDYFDITTFEEYWRLQLKYYYQWRKDCGYPFPNKEEAYQEWCKYYKRK